MADGSAISKDRVFDILSSARRRAILRYLMEHADRDEFSVQELTTEIAAWEHDVTVDQLSPDQRKRVYVSCYQTHLPKLADADIIEFDRDQGIIRPTPRAEVFRRYIEPDLHNPDEAVPVPDENLRGPSGLTETVKRLFE